MFGMLGVAAPAYAQTVGPDSPIRAIKGTIAAINSKTHTLTVVPPHGASVKVIVNNSTLVKRNGKLGKLAKLRVGDKTSLRYNTRTHKATNVNCVPGTYNIHGTIYAVNTTAGTITITPNEGGNNVMLKVNSSTTIQRNSSPVTLADLAATDLVEATYNSASMLASDIKAETNLAEIHGTIADIDTTANTITITPGWDFIKNCHDNIMLSVDSTTTIQRNGASASLADLRIGDPVDASYNSVTLLAGDIKAGNNSSDIQGVISAIDTEANTVTITPGLANFKASITKADADVVLRVDDDTVITRNGNSAGLDDLQVGDTVDATYDSVSMLASEIDAKNNNSVILGTISAIDTTANTVTIKPGENDLRQCHDDITLNIGASTVVIRDLSIVTLADLQVGDAVMAKYDSVSMLASMIIARDSALSAQQ
jgi:hypothetical protein